MHMRTASHEHVVVAPVRGGGVPRTCLCVYAVWGGRRGRGAYVYALIILAMASAAAGARHGLTTQQCGLDIAL